MLDADIRRALHAEIQRDLGVTIIDELGLRQGQIRADVAIVSGSVFAGYEIKSPADTLQRLPEQARVYSQVFDYATLVVAGRHLAEARRLVPDWWAVMVAIDRGGVVDLEVAREGAANPGVDKRALAELLWKDDAIAVLRRKGEQRGVLGKSVQRVWDRVAEVCSLDEVRSEVRARLKARAALWAEHGRSARIG